MRYAFLIVTLAAVVLGGIVKAELAVIGYIGFLLMRPDLLAWTQGPYLFAIALLAIGSSLRKAGNLMNLFINPFSGLLIIQIILIVISSALAVSPSLSWNPLNQYIRAILVQMLIPLVITDIEWFRRLILVMTGALGIVIAKFGLFGLIQSGGRLVRGMPGSMISDSNGLALAAVMMLPLAWYTMPLVEAKWKKLALAGCVVCAMATVASTGSRGNTLAMVVLLLMIVWRSKYKVAGFVGLAILSLPVIYVVGQRVAERMATVSSYEEDASASSRVELWKTSLKVIADHPILGVGYGEDNWVAVSPAYLGRPNHLKLHNTYLQMATDCGLPFFLVYAGSLWGAIFWMERSARRMAAKKPEWEPYPRALQGGLLAFAVGSTFYSRGDFELFYTLLMCAASWYLIEQRGLAEVAYAEAQARLEMSEREMEEDEQERERPTVRW